MLNEILKEVVVSLVGKPGEGLSDLLNTPKHVNEFVIAKKLDLTINQTRNLLYKISDQGLLSSLKKKDKKKGWFTYFWKIDIMKTLEFYRSGLLARKSSIDNHINSRETKEFFECATCGIEVTAENALVYDFTCPECGKIFTQKDNTKVLKDLKNESDKIGKILGQVGEELARERAKLGKSRAREVAKEKKERAEKRALNKKKKAAAENKTADKAVKKTAKKAIKKVSKKSVPAKKKLTKKTVKKTTKKTTKKIPKKTVKNLVKQIVKKSTSKSKSKKK